MSKPLRLRLMPHLLVQRVMAIMISKSALGKRTLRRALLQAAALEI